MATMISLCRLSALCAALALGGCATRGELSDIRQSLSWDGDQITWTVENPSEHSILVDDFTATNVGVPIGVWIRVTGASGERIRYSYDDVNGWYSPWYAWSSVWTPEPLELAPGARLQHTFTVEGLSRGLRVSEPIVSERCRYQVRVGVSRIGRRLTHPGISNAPPSTIVTSDWHEIACSALRIAYCPYERGFGGALIQNCSGRPLPEALRKDSAEP